MALLTNGGAAMTIPTASQLGSLGLNGTTNSSDSNHSNDGHSDDYFLSNLISSMPGCWDNPSATITKPINGLSKSPPGLSLKPLSDILGPIGAPQKIISHPIGMIPNACHQQQVHLNFQHGHLSQFPQIPENGALMGIGLANPLLSSSFSPSTSPLTSSGSTSSGCISTFNGNNCGRCDHVATNRCLDCNDVLCEDCVHYHVRTPFNQDHCIIPLNNVSPIGSTVSLNTGGGSPSNVVGSNGSSTTGGPPNINNNNCHFPNQQQQQLQNQHSMHPTGNEPQCEIHREVIRYVCETCKKLVCQECTLWDHKEHSCVDISVVAENGRETLSNLMESGKTGTRLIKSSIDRAVSFSQAVERDAGEATSRVRRAMRHFIMAAEERERTLIDRIDKMRQQKLSSLSDQMAGLRAALSGLAQTSDMFTKTMDNINSITGMELAQTIIRGENQVEQFATMYKNLQPKEEFIHFMTPSFELLQDIRNQGDVVMVGNRVLSAGSPGAMPGIVASGPIITPMAKRPITRNAMTTPVFNGGSMQEASTWDPLVPDHSPPGSINGSGKPRVGQALPGSNYHVVVKPALGPSTSFGFDGHEDGQVSRPWGLCVDKEGNILVADRRNNRVQVFYPDGSFKLNFGQKGSANGQFDLPAGISTDPQNRIVVVDKDNHRVQIFSSTGTFLLKFGNYGKDCGQFQYPWDVAVNSRGEILVTDSRNHRIQLFNPDGHFISRFSFDGVNHNRVLRGLTTPRGVCFTPEGHVIVSDFENHRLLLIDGGLNKILSAKGHEGTGIQEFCRPSGICCDDDGRVIVADSKNQRVMVFSPQLEFLWMVEIRPSSNSMLPSTLDEKDRPSDVALLPDGRLVVMVETSPDARDTSNPQKTFVQIY